MNQKELEKALYLMFKNEGMKRVIFAALSIVRKDKLTRRELKKINKIEKIVNKI